MDLDAAADGGGPQVARREVVLRALPKKLIVRRDKPMQTQCEGLPENHFPLSPVTVYWSLNTERTIEIHRRGFPVVPNFSTTLDGSMGMTMDTVPVDLGDVREKPSFNKAMKGYVAMSRVKKAEDLRLTPPISPALSRQGAQPLPTLLIDSPARECA